jgi:peptidoglycan hydrolase-like protein with peptidoglycan-binding domain
MKHLLNDLTEKEKNAIREQHTEKIKIDTSKFAKLVSSRLGEVKPILEQDEQSTFVKNQIKKVLMKEEVDPNSPRIKQLVSIYSGVKNGKITAGNSKGKNFCGYGGFAQVHKVTDEELQYLKDNYSDIVYSDIETLPNLKKEWVEIYNYFKNKTDGSELTTDLYQFGRPCEEGSVVFYGKTKEGFSYKINLDGTYGRSINDGRLSPGKWGWDANTGKPVFSHSVTKKASGYANTEEDILNNKKILNTGSRNDLVKRVQFEILYNSSGQKNPGCKKGQDGNYSPSLCDGIFGPKTKQDVKWFQTKHGLDDKSGAVGIETWNAMEPFELGYAINDEELGSMRT